MKIQSNKSLITFGILQKYHKTRYGDYTRGVFKDKRIEIYNATKYNQKLIYVSHNRFLNWIKSKLTYFEDGIKKVIKSERSIDF